MKNLLRVLKSIILRKPIREEVIVIELELVDVIALLAILALIVRLLMWVF